ncbi:uncharacterized protein LOC123534174 isoform X2 [Mercenaria mercenaria]|uniref:uncharacterized protein LOC123534174 isoform X2 n=1 Tax=Mercenaria mercenaria TaxID=6596 RepID=UPI00234F44D0|nr:uncharacterized protein LOC123534174 isoform X2 [Mercenaria mercenaria]
MQYQPNAKNIQWTKAAIGLKYLQKGLAPFCDHIVKQQHLDILDNVKKKFLTTAVCNQCNLRTLKPDHTRQKKKKCPLGDRYCNCCRRARTFCPKVVCGAIYDEIATYHTSTPCWKYTKAEQWTSEPWSIAQCFFNLKSQTYLSYSSARDTGISELLELILSNKYFHENITRMDLLSKVTQHKMSIYNSCNMQLDKSEVDMYIDDMIALLQDDKKLKHQTDAQTAVRNLQALKESKGLAEDKLSEDDCNKRSIAQQQVRQQKMYILKRIGTLDELDETDENKYRDVVTDIWQDAEKAQNRPFNTWKGKRKRKKKDQAKTKKSGPSQKEPDVFKVVIKITNLQFTEEIRAAGKDIGQLDVTLQLQTALQDLFRSLPGDIGIKIVDLQPGSLIVKFEIISNGRNTDEEIEQTLQKMLNKGSFSIYTVSRDEYDCRKITGTKKRFDGRLIKLEEKDIKILKQKYTKLIGGGSFGKVYSTSDDTVPADFGIRIARKKIDIQSKAREGSVRREMMASRILHPFILPLLAVAYRPFEKAILHKDIASRNVVLDAKYNARLIDFGLAREIDDQTATATRREEYWHPDAVERKTATQSWDYYSFGVIIREMLTSLKPEGDENNGKKLYLKNMEPEEVLKNLSTAIWVYKDKAKDLANIAEECLKTRDLSLKEFNTKVVEKIKKIWWRDLNQNRLLDVPDGHAKCHICMINPKATETSMRQDHERNCRQKIEACIACEKNSFLNPVRCYCDKDLKPTIGSRCGALLVAGNDEKKTMAEALKKDINELKKVITSLAPRIMGISEDLVRVVVPNKPGTLEAREKLWPEVKKHIEVFSKESEIDTLLIYYSCHGENLMDESQSNVFKLGSASDNIRLDEFEEELDCLGNIDKLIIVLDRCYPPKIKTKKRKQIIQINACHEEQEAKMTDEGSIFTKYFIQGLKAKSDKKKCLSGCEHCVTYWSNISDFISATPLFDYVRDHMSEYDDSQPVGVTPLEWRNIAFYTHEKVEIDFTWQRDDQSDKVQREIPLEYLQTLNQLEEKLCKVFRRDTSTTKVKIQKDTFRNKERFQDCDTLEKVMSAWVNRQPLTVKFENS